MWDTLTWPELRDEQVRDSAQQLREQTLRRVLVVTTAGYLVWQFASTFLAPHQDAPRSWAIFPVVAISLAATYFLLRTRSGLTLTIVCLLGSAVGCVTAAVWLLDAPGAMALYPIVAMVAVVMMHPLAGLVVTGVAVASVAALGQAGQLQSIGAGRLVETFVICLVAIVAASALGRDTLIATQWWLSSYEQALRKTREAQDQRAQVVKAMSQLSTAYHRLQQANAALEVAWRAADVAERSRTEFVTNISHELRTPLNLVVGFSEMILGSPESYGVPLPASYRADLNAVHRSARHLLALTNDVIDLAMVGNDRLALTLETVDLGRTIGEACDMVREYVALKGLHLRTQIPSDLPDPTADRLRIRQVLLNLLTNAARFTEHGGLTVSAESDADRVLVRVADTGRGIPHELLPRVFEEFYRSDGGTSRSADGFGGAGLGLPISKRLVELHGGQMGVESAVNAGTTFWFSLPIGVAPMKARPDSKASPGPSVLPTVQRQSLILVTSDLRLARFFERHLRGYSVITASDLPQAIASAAETHAAGILVNARDVGSDIAITAPVPVLCLPLPWADQMASTVQANAYLEKPVTQAELTDVLATLGRPIRSALIVDDDPSFADLMARMLKASTRQEHLSIVRAHSGRAALAELQTFQPDLVMLDIVMPELGGEETLAAIRADPRLADVPVLIISAQSKLEAQLRVPGAFSVHRVDGFRLDELLGAVEALLGRLGRLESAA
jgi:signal transduction histidine kinase/CheY-like chemotaxis protein